MSALLEDCEADHDSGSTWPLKGLFTGELPDDLRDEGFGNRLLGVPPVLLRLVLRLVTTERRYCAILLAVSRSLNNEKENVSFIGYVTCWKRWPSDVEGLV